MVKLDSEFKDLKLNSSPNAARHGIRSRLEATIAMLVTDKACNTCPSSRWRPASQQNRSMFQPVSLQPLIGLISISKSAQDLAGVRLRCNPDCQSEGARYCLFKSPPTMERQQRAKFHFLQSSTPLEQELHLESGKTVTRQIKMIPDPKLVPKHRPLDLPYYELGNNYSSQFIYILPSSTHS